MFSRFLGVLSLTLVVLSQVVLAAPLSARARAAVGANYTSPTFGYSLSYDSSWELVDTSVTEQSDRLVLKQEPAYVMIDGTSFFGGDVSACVDGIAEAAIINGTGYSEVRLANDSNDQPLQYADMTVAYAVYDYTFTSEDGKTREFTDLVQCVPLVPDQSVVAFLLTAPAEAYNDSLPAFDALVAGLTVPAAAPALQPTTCPDEAAVPHSGRVRIEDESSAAGDCAQEPSQNSEEGVSSVSGSASEEDARPEPHAVAIVAGTCGVSGQVAFALAPVSSTMITATASPMSRSAELVTTILDVSLAELVAGGYAIEVSGPGTPGEAVACGEVATMGSQADPALEELRIGLVGPEAMGIAWLWANQDGTTTVNVFLSATEATA